MVTSEIRESSHSSLGHIVMISQHIRRGKSLDFVQQREIVAKLTIGSWLGCSGEALSTRKVQQSHDASRLLSDLPRASVTRPTQAYHETIVV